MNERYFTAEKSNYFVVASRLEPYKKVDIVVEAFGELLPSFQLKVIGIGTEGARIKRLSAGYSNVEFLGFLDDAELFCVIGDALGFVFPPLEDFGILPIEAMAIGTPIVCYSRGGAVDYVRSDLPNGTTFDKQTIEEIAKAVRSLTASQKSFSPDALSEFAQSFDGSLFEMKFRSNVDKWIHQFFNSDLFLK